MNKISWYDVSLLLLSDSKPTEIVKYFANKVNYLKFPPLRNWIVNIGPKLLVGLGIALFSMLVHFDGITLRKILISCAIFAVIINTEKSDHYMLEISSSKAFLWKFFLSSDHLKQRTNYLEFIWGRFFCAYLCVYVWQFTKVFNTLLIKVFS